MRPRSFNKVLDAAYWRWAFSSLLKMDCERSCVSFGAAEQFPCRTSSSLALRDDIDPHSTSSDSSRLYIRLFLLQDSTLLKMFELPFQIPLRPRVLILIEEALAFWG